MTAGHWRGCRAWQLLGLGSLLSRLSGYWVHESFDFCGLHGGGLGLLGLLAMALATEPVCALGAEKVDADAAGFLFFFVRGGFHGVGVRVRGLDRRG